MGLVSVWAHSLMFSLNINSATEYVVLPWWHEPSEPKLGAASPSCQARRVMGSEQVSLHHTNNSERYPRNLLTPQTSALLTWGKTTFYLIHVLFNEVINTHCIEAFARQANQSNHQTETVITLFLNIINYCSQLSTD